MLQLAAVGLANRGASDAKYEHAFIYYCYQQTRRGRITLPHSYEPIVINTEDQSSSISGPRNLVCTTEHFTMANKLLFYIFVLKKLGYVSWGSQEGTTLPQTACGSVPTSRVIQTGQASAKCQTKRDPQQKARGRRDLQAWANPHGGGGVNPDTVLVLQIHNSMPKNTIVSKPQLGRPRRGNGPKNRRKKENNPETSVRF